jgi:hypothetical protein
MLPLLLILSSFADAYSFSPTSLKCRKLKATLEHVAPQYVTSIDTSPWHGMDGPFHDAQWLMPSIMERALIYGDTSVDAFKLLEVLDMSTSEREVARNVLRRNDGIVTTPILTKEECQKLRNFVRREIRNDGIDQVDGYPDWQVNISEKKLIKIIGQQAKDRLWKVPGMLDDDRATSFDKVGIFIRMYQKEERPWMPFHRDGNQWTVNVALNDSNKFKGGKLLALRNGRVEVLERNEGDATCHNDCIFHAVTSVLEGIRYTMILFFHKDLS